VLGAILLGAGRYDDATKHLNEALKLNPGTLEAHCQLANALEKRGEASLYW